MKKLTRETSAFTLFFSMLTLTVACGGGEDEAGLADDTAREITDAELSQMVLSLVDFGPEFAAFAPEGVNGALTFEQTVEEDDDPAAERGELEKFGWSATHKSFFENPVATTGHLGAGAIVYAFQTPDGASGYYRDSLSEYGSLSSPANGLDSVEIVDFETGDEATIVRIGNATRRDDGSIMDFWAEVVAFRRGRLLGFVAIYGGDLGEQEEKRLQGTVEGLASVMNGRMATVLAATAAPAAAGQ